MSKDGRSAFGRLGCIETQLPDQAGKGDAAVTLDSDLGPGPWLVEAVHKHKPLFGQRLACCLPAVPRLARQPQKSQVVLVQIEVNDHRTPPGGGLRRQVCGRFWRLW